jgi:arginine N-succinyltransferase
MFIRPANTQDHDAVLALAKEAGFGMTSLPPDVDVLAQKIDISIKSFAGHASVKGQESFLFVLEDPADGAVVGTCGIMAHVGLSQPFYSYKLTTITQASQQLDIFSKHTMLQVTNDLTGLSEVGALFLLPAYRRDRIGRMLSLSRFLFMAGFGDYFHEQVLAEMRGVHDAQGRSPFYDAVARHFFQMPFTKADYVNATEGNQFINDLMPKYPIYQQLLPESAQAVIGAVNPASEPAKHMLLKQGFKESGYVDIFDAGPTLTADRAQIKAIKQSQTAKVTAIADMPESATKYLVDNERFEGFRAAMGRMILGDDGAVTLSARLAERLELSAGDTLRYLPL